MAHLTKEEDQTAGTGGLSFWPLLLMPQLYPQESGFMDHFPWKLWVGLTGSENRGAVILWGASHLTVKWLCDLRYPDKKRYEEGKQ